MSRFHNGTLYANVVKTHNDIGTYCVQSVLIRANNYLQIFDFLLGKTIWRLIKTNYKTGVVVNGLHFNFMVSINVE